MVQEHNLGYVYLRWIFQAVMEGLALFQGCPESLQPCIIKNRGTYGWTFSRQPLYMSLFCVAELTDSQTMF